MILLQIGPWAYELSNRTSCRWPIPRCLVEVFAAPTDRNEACKQIAVCLAEAGRRSAAADRQRSHLQHDQLATSRGQPGNRFRKNRAQCDRLLTDPKRFFQSPRHAKGIPKWKYASAYPGSNRDRVTKRGDCAHSNWPACSKATPRLLCASGQSASGEWPFKYAAIAACRTFWIPKDPAEIGMEVGYIRADGQRLAHE